ncbi:hypothetical protein [Aureimonas leprariae]|uniref:Uncharacterized protein n=1 Tax=Plantimonas leprariae TaxID=2615207 RepID=A0A7V7TVJ7_9HYPH|nr:hypothetical protein [Aureimonas leprariae]KAB0678072.1 hypothetical protein F6X38_16740 [Aureimonas leprariae]
MGLDYRMPHRRYLIRRFHAVGAGRAIEDVSITGRAEAIHAAEHHAQDCLGVLVLDTDERVVARFGDVPASS